MDLKYVNKREGCKKCVVRNMFKYNEISSVFFSKFRLSGDKLISPFKLLLIIHSNWCLVTTVTFSHSLFLL